MASTISNAASKRHRESARPAAAVAEPFGWASAYDAADRRWVRAGAIAWVVATVGLWWWWLASAHRSNAAGVLLVTIVLACGLVAPAWTIVGLLRASVPRGTAPADLRVAMITTRAPSEPFELVRVGLLAMLTQRTRRPFDVWLADEDPTAATRDWCRRHGVRISSRKGVDAYNRATWPRRTRCKEGNLAYFYDCHGYDRYDVVCQFDADHVPSPTYLERILVPFADDDVAYVVAPSVCDANAATSWAARGRLHVEAAFHGPVQAGAGGPLAPICVGSHYAVRTAALRRIGGIGPELMEDFSTTLLLGAHGYRGAFALGAEAHGEGPFTISDAVIQEMQWARSLTALRLGVARGALAQMRPPKRWWLGLRLCGDAIVTLQILLAHVLVLLAIAPRAAWLDLPMVELATFRLVPALALTAIVATARRARLVRPVDAKLVSWERALLAFLRWPWVAAGVAQAALGHEFGRTLGWHVTPKRLSDARPLDVRIFAPHLGIAMVLVGAVTWRGDERIGAGVGLGLILAGGYVAAVAAAVVLHKREHPSLAWRELRAAVVAPAIAGAGVALAVGWSV